MQILPLFQRQAFALGRLPARDDEKNCGNQDKKDDQTGEKFGCIAGNMIRDAVKPHDEAENDQPDTEL